MKESYSEIPEVSELIKLVRKFKLDPSKERQEELKIKIQEVWDVLPDLPGKYGIETFCNASWEVEDACNLIGMKFEELKDN